jgi:hypothetical protein
LASTPSTSDSLRPWQFFTLGALFCATAAVFVMRGTSPGGVILVCFAIFAAALVAIGALRTLRPLVSDDPYQPQMIGSQTRASIEREKNLVLRSIKELEFDHAMGKVGEADYHEMVTRLRSRAVRLLQQIDESGSGTGYRELIERELASRLVKTSLSTDAEPAKAADEDASLKDTGKCPSCGTLNDSDAKFCKQCGTKVVALLLAILVFAAPAFAQFQMPDPRQMSGIPRPVTDLPERHISVRLIRGQLSNNIQDHPVELQAGDKSQTVKTDENGRAEFSGIAPGTMVKAVAVVDGERLESQEFAVPSEGGIRVMLVATPKEGSAPAPVFQPKPGTVSLGDQTRVIIDLEDTTLLFYYILDIRNTTTTPVNPPSPLIIDMPPGSRSTSVLGNTPQAVARGDRVTISGPFAPGQTSIQLAYQVPYTSGSVKLSQVLPLAVPGVAVLMKKVGEMSLASPQLPNTQERAFEGENYVLAQGENLAAGSPMTLEISGLPHHSMVPRTLTLSLALLILGLGFWFASRVPAQNPNVGRVKQLAGKKEKLFADLVRLEQQRRTGAVDPGRYDERRPALIAQLERVYRDLDAEGGQGAAA